jgi:hypothetical protein
VRAPLNKWGSCLAFLDAWWRVLVARCLVSIHYNVSLTLHDHRLPYTPMWAVAGDFASANSLVSASDVLPLPVNALLCSLCHLTNGSWEKLCCFNLLSTATRKAEYQDMGSINESNPNETRSDSPLLVLSSRNIKPKGNACNTSTLNAEKSLSTLLRIDEKKHLSNRFRTTHRKIFNECLGMVRNESLSTLVSLRAHGMHVAANSPNNFDLVPVSHLSTMSDTKHTGTSPKVQITTNNPCTNAIDVQIALQESNLAAPTWRRPLSSRVSSAHNVCSHRVHYTRAIITHVLHLIFFSVLAIFAVRVICYLRSTYLRHKQLPPRHSPSKSRVHYSTMSRNYRRRKLIYTGVIIVIISLYTLHHTSQPLPYVSQNSHLARNKHIQRVLRKRAKPITKILPTPIIISWLLFSCPLFILSTRRLLPYCFSGSHVFIDMWSFGSTYTCR